MGDPEIPSRATSFSNSLPPGSRFIPSEQQLISNYLTSKNGGANSDHSAIDVIKEIDLYDFEPFNLPDSVCFRFGTGGRKRHWYCYVGRSLSDRSRRKAGGGFWMQRKKVRDVVGAGPGKDVVGTRKSFVFYIGDSSNSKNAVKTPWVMYEYSLIGHHHAGSFVLCRIFLKSHTQKSLSENIISSCGEGSTATVRHVGVQCDGNVRSVVSNAKTHEKNSHDDDNKVSDIPTGQCNELDGSLRYEPVYDQDLMGILDEGFIELDDLLCPLPGID